MFNDKINEDCEESNIDLTLFHYDVKLGDEAYLTSKILDRNINILHQMYHVMPAFLSSFKFKDYSSPIFLEQSIEIYKNMPNHYGILEYYVNQKYPFKLEIDENLDFTKEDKLYERLLIVNSKVFILRTMNLREYISEINSVSFLNTNNKYNEAKISEESYMILSKLLQKSEKDILELLDDWSTLVDIDLLSLELTDNGLKSKSDEKSYIIVYISEKSDENLRKSVSELLSKISQNSQINVHIFIKETDDELIDQNIENKIKKKVLDLSQNFREFKYSIHNKNLWIKCGIIYNNIAFGINSQNDTDLILTFINKYKNVFNNFKEITNEINIKSFNIFISKLLQNFESFEDVRKLKMLNKDIKRDELMAEVYKTPVSGPQDQRYYRKSSKDLITLNEFLLRFIKPLSKLFHSKIDLSMNPRAKVYILCITDGGHIDTLKAMRLIQAQSHIISKVTLVFGKFQGQFKHDHIKSFSDYIINTKYNDNSLDLNKYNIFNTTFEFKTRQRIIVDDHIDLSLKRSEISVQFQDHFNFFEYEVTGNWKIIDPFILSNLKSYDQYELSKICTVILQDSYSSLDGFTHLTKDINNARLIKQKIKTYWMNDIMFSPTFLPEPGLYCISIPNKDREKHFCFNSLDGGNYYKINMPYNKSENNANTLMTNRYLSRFTQHCMNISNDEYTSHVLTFVYGRRYEILLMQSINSMIANQTMYSNDQTIVFWIIRNYIPESTVNELKDSWNCTSQSKSPKLCINIQFVSFKWFQGIFDKYEPIASEVQLARVMFVNQIIPFEVKKVIIKDADQIMQYGNILDFYRYDLSYEEETDNPDVNIPRLAVFGYVSFCKEPNKKYEGYRFWTSDYWRRYYNDKTYHFGAIGLVDVKLYTHFNTNKGMVFTFNGLKWKREAINCLDQDLINIYQINNKVVTIEGNWIWCETWCHEKLKKSAIFIDLCSAPSK